MSDELIRVQRAIARRETPLGLLGDLLSVILTTTDASITGVRNEVDGTWILPTGLSPSYSARLERAHTAPTPREWVIDVPIEDAGQSLGRLMLVIPTGPGASGRFALDLDTTRLVEVITMLLLSINADRTAPVGVAPPATSASAATPLTLGMQRDLAAGRFVPHFQPVVDLANGGVAAFDALVRWNHPRRGWISAAEFFPQAKKAGLSGELESIVFQHAAMRARRCIDRGVKRVRVNVKVSGGRFEAPALLEELASLIAQYRLPAATLGVMLTEKTLNRPAVVAALPAMRAAGFRITIEHFGTTATTAAALRPLPLYGLKIDHSIVRRLGVDPAADRAARAVVQTARTLELRTIAEGVETEAQRAILESIGCDAGQGFLWSPAVESEVADSFLRFQTFAGRPKTLAVR